jgi:hypothetical protein
MSPLISKGKFFYLPTALIQNLDHEEGRAGVWRGWNYFQFNHELRSFVDRLTPATSGKE